MKDTHLTRWQLTFRVLALLCLTRLGLTTRLLKEDFNAEMIAEKLFKTPCIGFNFKFKALQGGVKIHFSKLTCIFSSFSPCKTSLAEVKLSKSSAIKSTSVL